MGKQTVMNIQDSFLNQVRKDGSEVKITMLDGSSLVGSVRGFDNFTVVLHTKAGQHLLYKHAIAQILFRRPSQPEAREESHAAVAAPRPSMEPRKDKEREKAGAFNPIDLSGLHTDKNSTQ